MKPTNKRAVIEDALKRIFGFDRRESIAANKCVPEPVGCGGDATEFRDDVSRREFAISGLCQRCQDEVFSG